MIERSRYRLVGLCALTLTVSACGDALDLPSGDMPVTVADAGPSPTPSRTAIKKDAASTPPKRLSLSDMQPRKDFIDPPLPPELMDDGGLTPLPPNPKAASMR